MNRQELLSWLWYANAIGEAAKNAGEISRLYSTPQELMESDDYVQKVLTPYQYNVMKSTSPAMFEGRLRDCEKLSVGIITWADKNYPQQLFDIASPPPVLFYKGDESVLNYEFLFAMVGTRRPSAYGIEAAKLIANELCKCGMVMVSGMATGLDSEAHKAALVNNTPTVACLAFGHDTCYPAHNREMKQLIEKVGVTVSENPPGAAIHKLSFLNRNRIIAALSRGVCVAEARKSSGTMNTVAHALEIGRDVFAVPGSIFSPLSEGTNHLICEGAIPVVSGQDIIEHYAIEYQKRNDITTTPPPILVTPAAEKLFNFISPAAKTIEELSQESGLSAQAVLAALTELEIIGAVTQIAGRRFELSALLQKNNKPSERT